MPMNVVLKEASEPRLKPKPFDNYLPGTVVYSADNDFDIHNLYIVIAGEGEKMLISTEGHVQNGGRNKLWLELEASLVVHRPR